MSSISIFFSSDNELSEWEAINKEWRSDVYVLCNCLLFRVNIYTPVRLIQDFETEVSDYGFYPIDENIILVKNTDKKSIISSILKLYDANYFNKIKPMEKDDTCSLVKVY